MNPPEALQLFVNERLDPEADAIDTGGANVPASRDPPSPGSSRASLQPTGRHRTVPEDWTMAATSSGSSSDGVPPPKKIVSAMPSAEAGPPAVFQGAGDLLPQRCDVRVFSASTPR
jgi:hypothetical protein